MPYVPVLGEAERQLLLPLLSEGFPRAQIDWSSAFEAPAGHNGHGVLLLVDGAAQGAILTFEKKETVRGREVRFVNISSWYIRPRYRSLAWRMMRAITSEPDTVYTICSPIPSVQRICLQLGFRYASPRSIASVPLINGLFPPPGIEVLPFGAGPLPNAEHEAWIRDHGGGCCSLRIMPRFERRFAPCTTTCSDTMAFSASICRASRRMGACTACAGATAVRAQL
jgi:hypothetical protein